MAYPYELDLEVWKQAAPLAVVRAHRREHRLERERQLQDWESHASDEYRRQLAEVRELIHGSAEPQYGRPDAPFDEPEITTVCAPFELSMIEQFREERGIGHRGLPEQATDVFVWALGESKVRHATKVGGAPYRPADRPWPTIRPDAETDKQRRKAAGAPMTFLMQFCFSGSRDIFPELPGDVLLVFAEDEQFARGESLYFEWQSLAIDPLVDPADVTPPAWRFVTCHGYRHRTRDYQSTMEGDLRHRTAVEHEFVFGATKIGGIPYFIQDDIDRVTDVETWPGRFLAQLSWISPGTDHSYPWLNREEPQDAFEITPEQRLDLVDAGFLYFFLTESGDVVWEFQCH